MKAGRSLVAGLLAMLAASTALGQPAPPPPPAPPAPPPAPTAQAPAAADGAAPAPTAPVADEELDWYLPPSSAAFAPPTEVEQLNPPHIITSLDISPFGFATGVKGGGVGVMARAGVEYLGAGIGYIRAGEYNLFALGLHGVRYFGIQLFEEGVWTGHFLLPDIRATLVAGPGLFGFQFGTGLAGFRACACFQPVQFKLDVRGPTLDVWAFVGKDAPTSVSLGGSVDVGVAVPLGSGL